MKTMILLMSLFCAAQLWARTLKCEVLINLDVVWSGTVKTLLDEKVHIASIQGITSYITEKADNHFVVEAFLSQYEIRIYGQGHLNSVKDQVGASLWGRDMMADILCKPLSQN